MEERLIRILLVEDNPADQLAIRDALKGCVDPAFETSAVEELSEALERLAAGDIDLVLLDLGLPDSHGLETLDAVVRDHPGSPIVVQTGWDDEKTGIEAVRRGAQDYLVKGAESSESLLRIIRYAIERHRSEAARHRAEENFMEIQERFESLFHSAHDILYLHDFDGNLLDANEAALDFLGYERKELSTLNLNHLLDQENMAKAKESIKYKIQTGSQQRPLEYRVRRKDGEFRDLETRTTLVYRKGEPYAVQGIGRDLTDMKRATAEIEAGYQKLRGAMEGAIGAISMTVERRDPYTAGHQKRVAVLGRAIAQVIGMPEDRAEGVYLGGLVHDLGKISVPADILTKPSRLSPAEFQLIKIHPNTGFEILDGIEFPWPIARMAVEHHERMDGSGYPEGKKGPEILTESRILAVADVVEAMASHRPYRPALGIEAALDEIRKHRGTGFDPEVVDACIDLFENRGWSFDTAEGARADSKIVPLFKTAKTS